jgi:hypothetical protein
MDLDEGDMDSAPTGNFTEELNSFYSEIGNRYRVRFVNIFLLRIWYEGLK